MEQHQGLQADDVVAVAPGNFHSMALKRDGSVWATGQNSYGQLGNPSIKSTAVFMKVVLPGSKEASGQFKNVSSSGARALAVGLRHTIILKRDGSVWATGQNDNGQLGDTYIKSADIFVKIIQTDVQAVVAGGYRSFVLTTDGSWNATGKNNFGQLGDGSRVDKTRFARVASIAPSISRTCEF